MRFISTIDQSAFKWISEPKSEKAKKWAPRLSKFISSTGDGYLYAVLIIGLYFTDTQNGAMFATVALLSFLIEIPLFIIMKNVFKRPRPCDFIDNVNALVTPSDKFSLPSGHTAAAFLVAVLVYFYYPAMGIAAITWASLIGLSRVMLRVHYPMDVIIGMALGSSVAIFSIVLLEQI